MRDLFGGQRVIKPSPTLQKKKAIFLKKQKIAPLPFNRTAAIKRTPEEPGDLKGWSKRELPRILPFDQEAQINEHPDRDLIKTAFKKSIILPEELHEIFGRNTFQIHIVFELDEEKNTIEPKVLPTL